MFLSDPNLEVTNRGQVLRIKSARLGDQARYQCSATNTAGKQSKDFNLTVYGKCVILSKVNFCLEPPIISREIENRWIDAVIYGKVCKHTWKFSMWGQNELQESPWRFKNTVLCCQTVVFF